MSHRDDVAFGAMIRTLGDDRLSPHPSPLREDQPLAVQLLMLGMLHRAEVRDYLRDKYGVEIRGCSNGRHLAFGQLTFRTGDLRALVRALWLEGVSAATIKACTGVYASKLRAMADDLPARKMPRGRPYKRGAAHGNSIERQDPSVLVAIRAGAARGLSAWTLADELSIGLHTVRRVASRHGIPLG